MSAHQYGCYQCVACGTPVELSDQENAKCRVCLSQCPSVLGTEVRVTQAGAKLRATVDAYRRHHNNLNLVRNHWELLRSSNTSLARRLHAERAIAAHDALLGLSNEVSAPIERCLAKLPAPHWLDDILSLDGSNAWDIDHMLPYFYQDWHSTGDFPAMRDRIRGTIACHASAAAKLLIVGAGACGLVRDLALSGFEVHAVDLSLPCLVLASRLLNGDTLEVAIPHKFERSWGHTVLPGAAPFVTAPRLSVANAARLPVQDRSFPVVVTQYLIDVVTNPTQVIIEIARVLEEGGLWVNFGLPFGLSNDPPELGSLCDEAMEPVLRDFGFDLISLERQSFRLSDTTTLFDWPEVTTHWPQLIVARRANAARCEGHDVFQCFRAGMSDAIWNCQPRRLPGRLLRGGPGSMPVSDASAAMVRWIGVHADGRTRLSTLRDAAQSVDHRITDLDLVEVVRLLCDEGMLTLETNSYRA